MTHLVIENQNSNVEIVNAAIILKLYNSALGIEENLLEGELLSDYVSLKGNLLSDRGRQSALIYLNNKTKFPNLLITVPVGLEYIDFEDPLVELILLSNGAGDGIGITTLDMANLESKDNGEMLKWFAGSNITKFDEFSKLTKWTRLSYNNANASSGCSFQNCTSLTSIDLSNIIYEHNAIGAFRGCSSLQTVKNYRLSTILLSMFLDCTSLTTFDLSGITTIKAKAFKGCTGLTSIDLSNITSLEEGAFENCTGLTSIDLSSLTTATGSATNKTFGDCTSLTTVTNCNKLANYMFYRCSSLININLTSNVTSINSNAFYGCSSLTSIDIPNSVTSIGQNAFTWCTGLTSVDIPDSVTSINGYVFYNCNSLISVTVNATTPPALNGINSFNSANNCLIYVPSQSVETYKSASGWSSYASRIRAIPTT